MTKRISKSYLKLLERKYRILTDKGLGSDDFKEIKTVSGYNRLMGTNITKRSTFVVEMRKIRSIEKHINAIEVSYLERLRSATPEMIKKQREISQIFFNVPDRFESVVKTDEERARFTKFEQMSLDYQEQWGISEKEANARTRAFLKIPKKDIRKLKRKDREVLEHYGY